MYSVEAMRRAGKYHIGSLFAAMAVELSVESTSSGNATRLSFTGQSYDASASRYSENAPGTQVLKTGVGSIAAINQGKETVTFIFLMTMRKAIVHNEKEGLEIKNCPIYDPEG